MYMKRKALNHLLTVFFYFILIETSITNGYFCKTSYEYSVGIMVDPRFDPPLRRTPPSI